MQTGVDRGTKEDRDNPSKRQFSQQEQKEGKKIKEMGTIQTWVQEPATRRSLYSASVIKKQETPDLDIHL